MKNYALDINTLWSKISSLRYSYNKIGIKPERDWIIMFLVGTLMVSACTVFAGYFYYQISNRAFFQVERVVDESQLKINRPLLDSVVREIDIKNSQFYVLDNNLAVGDPGS